MTSYPPGPSSRPLPAEEFELSEAGPSRSPTLARTTSARSKRRRSSGRLNRTLTLPPNESGATLLFSAPPSAIYTHRKRYSHSSQPPSPGGTPRRANQWAQFLTEGEDTPGEGAEEVHVPDFGHMLGFNPEDEDHFAVAQGMRSDWRRRLYLLMEEPSSGREAFFVHIMVTGGIIFSALLTTLSTLPSFHTDPSHIRALFGLDTTIVVLFTIEYLARTLAHSDSWTMYYNWATSFFPLLDFIAILPYYIEVAREQDTSILFRFAILRTFRLLRVFRAFKYQNQMLLTIEVMYVAVQRSKDALVALSFFILLVLVFFSTLIYFAERGTWDASLQAFVDADGDPSQFDSIPQTAWFALVTMSTVGYGDVVPRSSLGKLLSMPLLMFGLLLIALPSFVLGRNFAIVFDAMTSQANNKPISPSVSSRPSYDDEATLPNNLPIPEGAAPSAPLLPTNSADLPTGSTLSRTRGVTPGPSASASIQRGVGTTPRMWDGGFDGTETKAARADLTNVKLAKNQLVLLEQIDSLRRQTERQGEMLARLTEILEGRQRQPPRPAPSPGLDPKAEPISRALAQSPSPVPVGLGLLPDGPSDLEQSRPRRSRENRTPRPIERRVAENGDSPRWVNTDGEEEQFKLGDSDGDDEA
ncbi:hypothetical protein EHS25_009447 [Saitozyma podzolica]|uniref:Ion transport domain-containing protein n=1 Tax=Saitozyma podzolica TaxID=1890683 RepID=A0A427YJ80_9TREE|nr:hypothetical protein EHS25_009447 [Saitozyma podzolica]